MYAIKNDGCTVESPCGKYIADILLKDGNVVEIQTGTLSSLVPKLKYFLEEKKKVTVVYPLAVEKNIETFCPETGAKRIKRSPKKLNICSIFRELTKLYPFLLNRNFTLEVIEVEITEERTESSEPMQSKNGRRRFRKNWNKTGKRLEQAGITHVFHGKTSWKKLLPAVLLSKEKEFTSKEFFMELKEKFPKAKKKESDIMLWVYTKMELFERTGEKKGNAYIYRPL